MAIIPSEASIVETRRSMRERGATQLVVALGLDPAILTAGDLVACN